MLASRNFSIQRRLEHGCALLIAFCIVTACRPDPSPPTPAPSAAPITLPSVLPSPVTVRVRHFDLSILPRTNEELLVLDATGARIQPSQSSRQLLENQYQLMPGSYTARVQNGTLHVPPQSFEVVAGKPSVWTLHVESDSNHPVLLRIPTERAVYERWSTALTSLDVQIRERAPAVDKLVPAAPPMESAQYHSPFTQELSWSRTDGWILLGTVTANAASAERVVLTSGAHVLGSLEYQPNAADFRFNIEDAQLSASLGTLVIAPEPDPDGAALQRPWKWDLQRLGRAERGGNREGTLQGAADTLYVNPGWWLLTLQGPVGAKRQQVLHVAPGARVVAQPRSEQGNSTLELIPAYPACRQSLHLQIARIDGPNSLATPVIWRSGWSSGTDTFVFRNLVPGEYSVVCKNGWVAPTRVVLAPDERKSIALTCQAKPIRLEIQVGPHADDNSLLTIIDTQSGAIVDHRAYAGGREGWTLAYEHDWIDLTPGEYEFQEHADGALRTSQRVVVAGRKPTARVFW